MKHVVINHGPLQEKTYVSEDEKTIYVIGECSFSIYDLLTGITKISNKNFKGVTTLKDGDESNIKIAKRIAQCKMERQYHKYLKRLTKEEIDTYKKHISNVKVRLAKETSIIHKIDAHIKDLIDLL